MGDVCTMKLRKSGRDVVKRSQNENYVEDCLQIKMGSNITRCKLEDQILDLAERIRWVHMY